MTSTNGTPSSRYGAAAVRDTREKLVAYQGIASLREYALAEQHRREVRVYRRTGATWDLATFAGTTPVELSSVELSVSLDEISLATCCHKGKKP